MKYLIASLSEDELEPGELRQLRFVHPLRKASLLTMRLEQGVVAWLNECPHWSLPLGIAPAHILVEGGLELRCTTHDARFRLEDGVCTRGPCYGDALEPVPVCVALGRIFFFLPWSDRIRPRRPGRSSAPHQPSRPEDLAV